MSNCDCDCCRIIGPGRRMPDFEALEELLELREKNRRKKKWTWKNALRKLLK